MPPSTAQALAQTALQIRAEDARRVALMNAARIADGIADLVGPSTLMSDADVARAAAERVAGRNSEEMVLRRTLRRIADAGSEAAEMAYSAACRGDADWQHRARALLAPVAQERAVA